MTEHTQDKIIGMALAIAKNIIELSDSMYEAETIAYFVHREILSINMKVAFDEIEKGMNKSTVIKPDLN